MPVPSVERPSAAPLGVLMLDTHFPRVRGDIGNARSFDFPVLYHVVDGATPRRVATRTDPALLDAFLEGARRLERAGVQAITTSCGFLALWQKELSAAVSVPLLTSSLLQVPLAWRLTGGRPVAIVTARAANLSPGHLAAVGIDKMPLFVTGLDGATEFTRVFIDDATTLREEAVRQEVLRRTLDIVEAHEEIGAIVLECTNLPPYADALRQATKRPVFDILTLCNHVVRSLRPL